MPTYPATDDVDVMDSSTPAGTDNPNEIDDALRETRLVLQNVIKLAHTSTGGHRAARIYHATASAVPTSGAIDTWTRVSIPTSVDPTSLLQAAAHTNSFKPIQGSYKVTFFVTGYKLDHFACRIAQSTSNTTSTAIGDLIGTLEFSNASEANTLKSIGQGFLDADGVKSYCLDAIFSAANATDGHGRALATDVSFNAGFGALTPLRCGIFLELLNAP